MLSTRDSLASILSRISTALWLCIGLMLIIFPAQRAHVVTEHVRAPEVRRAIERNVVLEQTKNDVTERIATSNVQPLGLVTDEDSSVRPRFTQACEAGSSIPARSVSYLLHRLKLGRSSPNTPDPLI